MPAPKVRSKDSVQQRLRDHKRQWNSNYRDFSQKLKAFKDGLNGRGNAKVGLPPSNIKEPMPGEIGSYLSGLAGEFQSIVGDAESIIAEQAQYAKTRRRKRPKAPGQPAQAPEATQAPAPGPEAAAPAGQDKVVETLGRLGSEEYALEKEASSKLSRFWQYLSAIFSKKEYNKQRVGLLSQAADLYYSLLDLENGVLSLSIGSIPNTVAKYRKFKYNFDSFVGTFRGVEAMVERAAASKGVVKPEESDEQPKDGEVEEPENVQQQAPAQVQEQEQVPEQSNALPPELQKIRYDIHLLFNVGLAKQPVIDLHKMFTEYEEESDPHLKSMWADRIKESFEGLKKHLANEVQKRYGPTSGNSIQDLIALVKKNQKKAELVSEYMIKTSHSALSRYLKKKLVKSLPFNKTAPARLEAIDAIEEMKENIKNIMDNLEKDLSIQEIKLLLEKLDEGKDSLKRPLHVLNIFFMKEFFTKKEQKKKKNQKGKEIKPELTGDEELMDYVLQRKLKRELSEDLV